MSRYAIKETNHRTGEVNTFTFKTKDELIGWLMHDIEMISPYSLELTDKKARPAQPKPQIPENNYRICEGCFCLKTDVRFRRDHHGEYCEKCNGVL